MYKKLKKMIDTCIPSEYIDHKHMFSGWGYYYNAEKKNAK